ncbi:MAG TPA: hypothetical protein VHW23_14315, partial [Kofleriaceae bacterium]|nr:hypothetical protein [Kofleriaceae bacterium]
ALALVPASASAWEPQTTQAGLAEQAALASRLHKRLVSLGFVGGLFEPLTIPPADAPALAAALKLLSPTHGSVPDGRGRQSALAWLTAGAALADMPASQAANHFFDPLTGAGWTPPERGLGGRLRELIGQGAVPDKGIPAPDWLTAKTNPFNLDQFLNQYAKAVSAATPGERSRYMAAALVAAGAMLHTLGDLGAPSRVRGDASAHLEPLGAGPDDLGSRFERIAALTYGRLGVPPPSRTVTRSHLRDYITAKDGGGLADLIARSYFSPNTLPETTRVSGDLKPRLARPQPALPTRLNIMAATRDEGASLRSATGTCLARYRVDHDFVTFSIDDDCLLEQLAAILPEVAAYETGLLDFLLRGELTINVGSQITVAGAGLGAGSIEVLVEDDRGVRTSIASASTPAAPASPASPAAPAAAGSGAATATTLASVAAPAAGTRVVAVYRGVDAAGEPIVAVGAMPLTH